MKLAILMRKASYRILSWWPSLLNKSEEGDKIVPFTVLDLDMILRTFLHSFHRNDVPRVDLRTKGINYVQLWDAHWRFDKRFDEEFLLRGVMYLIASLPGFFERMKAQMAEMGYDFGEYDEPE